MPGENSDGVQYFAVLDDNEKPYFFVRAETLLRLHIQFGPDKMRNAKGLLRFLPKIAEDAKARGHKQIIYDSVVRTLIKFTKMFGYHPSPNEIVKDL